MSIFSDVNSCTFSGRLTRDAMVRPTPKGSFVRFSVACNRSRWDSETQAYLDEATFVDCSMYVPGPSEKTLKVMGYLEKGTQVVVSGAYEDDRWTDKDGQSRVSKVLNVSRDGLRVFTQRDKAPFAVEGLAADEQPVPPREDPLTIDELKSDYGAVEVADHEYNW